MMLISALFCLVAMLYAAVGFGGGSSYIAILALANYHYTVIPIIALLCNLIVVVGGSYHFTKKGFFKWKLFWPFILSSIPMAFVGGRIPISKELFLTLLGACLFCVGIKLLVFDRVRRDYAQTKRINIPAALVLGSILGLLSGIVGIGGGIFLAPILLQLRWGLPKEIAATAAFFILLNSFSGLLGQLVKSEAVINYYEFIPLFLAVLVGGQLGSRAGSGRFLSHRIVGDLTACLVLFVSIRILWL